MAYVSVGGIVRAGAGAEARAGEECGLLVKSEYGLWQDEVMMTRGDKDTNAPLTATSTLVRLNGM